MLYFLFQLFAGYLSGCTIYGIFGDAIVAVTPQCGYWMKDGTTSTGNYVLFLAILDLLLLLCVYAVGLDGRASSIFGPITSSLLVALSYSLVIFTGIGFSAFSVSTNPNDDQGLVGYEYLGINPAFCTAAAAVWNQSDVDTPANWAAGLGYCYAGLLVGIIIHTLYYYASLPAVANFDNQDEEIARNKLMLDIKVV